MELQVGPLALIDKLLQCLLQIFKYAYIRTLYLTVIDVDPRLQFLSKYG